MNWTSRNYKPRLFMGLRNRLIRSGDRISWPWKTPLLWKAFVEACQW
jgi:hypothetical protein